eukprot:scaffold1282_cov251-Pinguiococcus_pyrenoidosus.AAC.39
MLSSGIISLRLWIILTSYSTLGFWVIVFRERLWPLGSNSLLSVVFRSTLKPEKRLRSWA